MTTKRDQTTETLTVGIDLAFQDDETALCAVRWTAAGARVEALSKGVNDEDILRWSRRADKVAVDAPFGWPLPYPAFITAHMEGREVDFPGTQDPSLWFRLTDQRVKAATGKQPLSPAAEKLAKPTARCASLQQLLAHGGIAVDRSGSTGRVIETYPGAVVARLGLLRTYKANSAQAHARRQALASHLVRVTGLVDAQGCTDRLVETDDHLDAFVCALVAHAHLARATDLHPASYELPTARREGWIQIPSAEYLKVAEFSVPD